MSWTYVPIGMIRRHVPAWGLFAVMRLRGGANGAEQAPDVSFARLTARLTEMGVDLAGRRVLEVGSGRTARLALRMIAAGASHVTQVDFYATSLDEPAHARVLAADCLALGLDPEDALGRITVLRGNLLSIPTGDPVDLVLSDAVLEHVREPAAVLARCYEWLRPGGLTFHIVDLRDHTMGFRYPFEMLTFSDATWEGWLDMRGGFHLNRWRAPDYLRAMDAVGFREICWAPTRVDRAGLLAVRPRLAPRFAALDDDVLAVTGVVLLGVRAA